MGETKMISASLDNQMGKPAREDLVFSFSEETVVKEGEEVTRDHISVLNDLVQAQLSRLYSKHRAIRLYRSAVSVQYQRPRRMHTCHSLQLTGGAQHQYVLLVWISWWF